MDGENSPSCHRMIVQLCWDVQCAHYDGDACRSGILLLHGSALLKFMDLVDACGFVILLKGKVPLDAERNSFAVPYSFL